MGYNLLYDKQILFDPYTGDYITDAQLSMSVNTASYFDFTISLGHSLYDTVAEHAGLVELYFDKIKLFAGEITEIDIDIEGNKSISCTGAMDYLSDSLVRPYSTVEGEAALTAPSSVDGYFQWLIDQHNEHCRDSRKQFSVGVNQGNMLDTNNYIYRASDQRPTTASEIEDKILDALGGYLFVRYQDDMNVLDLYADAHEANTQIIDFGVNITDFTKTTTTDSQYTAVVATGYTPDPPEDDPEKEMKPITLEGCVDGGTPYSSTIVKMGDVVYDIEAVARYGYKEYYASNDDVTTYDGLLQYACKVLNTLISPSLSITANAVDLALYMDNGYEHMQVGQAVRVRSKLHNVDEYLMVNSITLDLNDPGNTEYTLGVSYDTLTGQQSSYLKSLNAGINKSLDSVASLDQATKDAAKDAKAAKTSTNTLETLIRQSGNGVEVAKKVNGSYTSTKTLMSNTGFSIKTSDDSKTLGSFTSNGITLGDTMAGLYTKVTTDGVAIMKPGAVVSGQEATKQVGYFSKDGVYLNGRSCQISSNSAMTYPTTTISSKGDVTIRNNSESAILTDSAFMQMTRYRDYASGGRTYNYESVDIDAYCNKKYAAITVSAGTSYTTASGASTATGLSKVQVSADDIYLGTSSSADTFVKGRFAINDQYMNDFVIEEGESTTTDGKWSGKSWRWRWIKTKSGKCFAWGECDFNISCTYSWGSGYYDSVQPVYPFNLKNWNIQATVVFAGGGIGHTCIYDDTSTQAPMYIWSAVYQTTGTMYPKVFVEGTLA